MGIKIPLSEVLKQEISSCSRVHLDTPYRLFLQSLTPISSRPHVLPA